MGLQNQLLNTYHVQGIRMWICCWFYLLHNNWIANR